MVNWHMCVRITKRSKLKLTIYEHGALSWCEEKIKNEQRNLGEFFYTFCTQEYIVLREAIRCFSIYVMQLL